MSRSGFSSAGNTANRLREEMDRLFGGLMGQSPFDLASAWVAPKGYPAVNVWEDDNALFVEAEVPGLQLEELEITVKNNELTIAGEHKAHPDQEAAYHRSERRVGKFQREFKFEFPLNADGVTAMLADGVLSLKLPKAEEARPRKIEIKRN